MTNNRSAFVIAVLTDYWPFDIEEFSEFKILPKLDARYFYSFLADLRSTDTRKV